MAGYRTQFIQALSKVGTFLPTQCLAALTQQKLIVPVYHVISDENLPHIKHLYAVKGTKAFIQDLDFLLKNYQPIDVVSLQNMMAHGEKPKKNTFLLTFDDGLREFYEVIAPILLQKGVPAVCFLNSDFIDNKDLMFRYKASLLIDEIEKNKNILSNNKAKEWLHENIKYGIDIQQFILSLRYHQKNILDELTNSIEVNFYDYLTQKKPYLTAEQVNDLINKGFHFGAHSCDHPEYQFIDLQEQLRQTKQSINEVVRKFNLSYQYFAFPFTDYGVSQEFFNEMYTKGGNLEMSFGCAGMKREINPYHLQRIPLEMSDLSAKSIVNTEYLYFILKAMFGKNTIRR
jgi:peptidoglycan/xylan/chitin deacetylase (PgdA/CDA1 family)